MLITDKLIYIELHKTGCTHTRSILADMFPDSHKIANKHGTYNNTSKDILGDFEEKIKIGNIRNPWDWYVSLWAYGCDKKGGLYNVLTQNRSKPKLLSKKGVKCFFENIFSKNQDEYFWLNPEIWRKFYEDSENYENFNTWLSLILSKEKFRIGENYKSSHLSEFVGFFTYRYIKLYTYGNHLDKVKSISDLMKYDAEENFMDEIIKNEHINQGLILIANKLKYDLTKLKNILKRHNKRTNKSNRDKDYRKYYNKESIELVEKYDSFIIEKFNYKF